MLVSVTCSLSVPLKIFHPLAACQLEIFSILSRDCNSIIVPANVIVKRNCSFQCCCLILIETFVQVMGSTRGMNLVCESLLEGLSVHVVTLVHPGLLNSLLLHREFGASLGCLWKCVRFSSKLSPQCCRARNFMIVTFPLDKDLRQESVGA